MLRMVRSRPRIVLGLFFIGALALLIAACNGGEKAPTPTAAATPRPVATSTPVPPTATVAPTATAAPRPTPTSTPVLSTPAPVLPTPTSAPADRSITLNMAAIGGSGQTGTATLTPKGEQTEVVLNLRTGPAGPGVPQPAHIHDTECQLPPKVVYPLTSVVDGKSTTLVNASLTALQERALAICVHKSAPEVTTYTASVDLPRKTAFAAKIANLVLPNLTVPVGTTVTWTNQDSVSHTVTSGKDGKFDGTGWNSDFLNTGQTFSRAFPQTGTFAYTCRVHPTLNATVTVTQSGPASATAGEPGTGYEY